MDEVNRCEQLIEKKQILLPTNCAYQPFLQFLQGRFVKEGASDLKPPSCGTFVNNEGSEVKVGTLQCEVTGFIEDLRENCIHINRSPEFQGRSFLVPAEWGFSHCRCSLENVALEVFNWHTQGMAVDRRHSGAEWWVQVR